MNDLQDQLEEYAKLWYLARHIRDRLTNFNDITSNNMDAMMNSITMKMKQLAFKKWSINNNFRQKLDGVIIEVDIKDEQGSTRIT